MAIKVYSPTDFEDTSSGVSIDGNLVVDTSVLYIDTANDRVGIGTTNPLYPLVVESSTSGLVSRIYNTNTDGQGLLIRAGSTSSATRVLQLASSNDTKIMTVNSNGNVGIGTNNPAYKLDVAGEVGIDSYIRHNGDSDTFFGFNNVDSYKIRVGGADRMTMSLSSTIFSNDVSSTGYLQTYGRFYHREHIVVLNKAQNGWVQWATRNTSGTDSVIDLSNIGTLNAASQTISGNLTVEGIITAQEFHTEFVSASIIYES